MTEREKGISHELRPYVDDGEAEALDRLAARLFETDPAPPSAAFRSSLKAHLVELESRRIGDVRRRPRRLRVAVASYVGSGLGLLGIAALAAVGSGPLA